MRLYKAIVVGGLTATAATGTAVALPALTETAAGAASGPGVTANLWNWNWKSVAKECTDVLGPAGYGSVQVSPPADSMSKGGSVWWDVYQPARYVHQIRRAIPALQMGQYSTEGVSGQIAYKRRYTGGSTDSFVLVTVSSGATFTGIPNGTYVDAVTGDRKTVTGGTLSIDLNGKGDMRAYVLDLPGNPAPGQDRRRRAVPQVGGPRKRRGGSAEALRPGAHDDPRTGGARLSGSQVTQEVRTPPPGELGRFRVVITQTRVRVEVPDTRIGEDPHGSARVHRALLPGGDGRGRCECVRVGDVHLNGQAGPRRRGNLRDSMQEQHTGRIQPVGQQGTDHSGTHRNTGENGARRQLADRVAGSFHDDLPADPTHQDEPIVDRRGDLTGVQVRRDDLMPGGAEAVGGSTFDSAQPVDGMEQGDVSHPVMFSHQRRRPPARAIRQPRCTSVVTAPAEHLRPRPAEARGLSRRRTATRSPASAVLREPPAGDLAVQPSPPSPSRASARLAGPRVVAQVRACRAEAAQL